MPTGIPAEAPSSGYATLADFAAYMHIDLEDVPADTERLLARAGELIDAQTLGRAPLVTDSDTLGKFRLAACAQVEYWLASGEDVALRGNIQGYSVKSFSVTFGMRGEAKLAPRAYDALLRTGLLYRGVRLHQLTASERFFQLEKG